MSTPSAAARPADSADTSRNPALFTRGRPFEKGNPGRPKGARNKVNAMADALLAENAEALVKKAIELGLAGNVTALRLCLERVVPPRREPPVGVALPPIASSEDATTAATMVANLVAEGELSPAEGKSLTAFFKDQRFVLRMREHEEQWARAGKNGAGSRDLAALLRAVSC